MPRRIEDHRIDLALRLIADATGSGIGDPQKVKDALRDLFTWTPECPPEQFDELRASKQDALERAASAAVLEERGLDPTRVLTEKELTRIARRHGVDAKGLTKRYQAARVDPDFDPDPKGDWEVPFFTETYLYTLLGKSDARSLLGRVRMVCEAIGLNHSEQAALYRPVEDRPRLLLCTGPLRGKVLECRDYDSLREMQHPLEWGAGVLSCYLAPGEDPQKKLVEEDERRVAEREKRGY